MTPIRTARTAATIPSATICRQGRLGREDIQVIAGARAAAPLVSAPADRVQLMRMLEGIYRSSTEAREVALAPSSDTGEP